MKDDGGADWEARWIQSVEARFVDMEKKIDRLEAFKNWLVGIGTLIGFVVGLSAKRFASLFGP